MLQAVILAAGFGTRLRPLTDDRPKALVPLDGVPLLGRALDALAETGVKDVTVVTGYREERVRAYLAGRDDVRVATVENPVYATTNTLASLLCAEAFVIEDDFLLLDGDLAFEAAVVAKLSEPGTRLAVDRCRPLDEDAVKIAVDGERIVAVGKQLSPDVRPIAESIGMARIDHAIAPRLFAVGRAILDRGEQQAYYEAAFQQLIEEGAVFEPADVTGRLWVEIDDHDDLRRARAYFAR